MDEENKVNGELVELEVPAEPETNGIQIANEVVAVIAGKAVSDVPGVASMAGGFAGVFSGKKNVSRGIKVEANDKATKIDVNIIVEYGHRIPDVAFAIQNRVKKAVETMTGLSVAEVNVHVQGVDIDVKKEDNKQNGGKLESAE